MAIHGFQDLSWVSVDSSISISADGYGGERNLLTDGGSTILPHSISCKFNLLTGTNPVLNIYGVFSDVSGTPPAQYPNAGSDQAKSLFICKLDVVDQSAVYALPVLAKFFTFHYEYLSGTITALSSQIAPIFGETP